MKAKKLFLPLLLFVACVFALAACSNQNDNNNDNDEAAVEEFIANFDRSRPFVDNSIIVVLTEEISFEYIFHDYNVEDFSGIGAIEVDELDGATSATSGLTYKIRQCLLEDPSGNTIPEHLKHYNRFFSITLDKNDEDNVLRAVYILRQRADIYLADPNFIESPDV